MVTFSNWLMYYFGMFEIFFPGQASGYNKFQPVQRLVLQPWTAGHDHPEPDRRSDRLEGEVQQAGAHVRIWS